MSNSTLMKIWTVVALAALYCSSNGILDVQGSAFLMPFLLEISDHRGQATKAIFWFVLSSLPYIVCLSLARHYIARTAARSACQAWPVMFGLELQMDDDLARRYQWFWLLLLLLLPLYACGFLLNEVFELLVFQNRHTEILAKGWVEHLTTFRFGGDFRIESSEDCRSTSYYPGFQDVAFLVVFLVTIYQWIRVVIALMKMSRKHRA
jgi:hypothetical protein